MSKLPSPSCWIDSDEIIWSKISNPLASPFEIKDAHELIEKHIQLCEHKSSACILDLRDLEQSIDQEVILFYSMHKKLNTLRKSQAFLTRSMAGWFFASHFTNYVNKTFPCRVFSEETEARKWLHSQT